MTETCDPNVRDARILAEDGTLLTAAAARFDDSGEPAVLCAVESRGALLSYYFGRGKRRVLLDVGEFRLRGTLATDWARGARLWNIALTPIAS